MENLSVKNSKAVFMANLGAVSKNQESVGSESFARVFDETQGSKKDNIPETEVRTDHVAKKGSVNEYEKLTDRNKADALKEKVEQLEKITEEERMQAACEEAGATMIEKVAETFNVSVEEVETVMESLGLTSLDLLNCENITKVVLALNPGLDALSIMTDENLFTDLKNLMKTSEGLISELQKQFQMNEDELNNYLQTIQENPESDLIMESEWTDMEKTGQLNGVELPETEQNGENKIDRISFLKENTSSEAATDTSLESSAALKTEGTDKGKEASQGNENQSMGKESFTQAMMRQLTEAVEKSEAAQGLYHTSGEDIIHQITDYIKLHVKPQTTELELQLHPASLGNVKVQIASTEGILTATFTTQNEAVKAALEAQLIQLKENFEQQGLKVESIEVNVATQGFERSLDQQSDQNRQYEENNKRSGRKIRLSGIDSIEEFLEEELAEEDKVVADMMLRNGNTVDYTI